MKTLEKTAAWMAFFGALSACTNDLQHEELIETDEVVNPSGEEQALTMPACGTALATFDGTDARSNAGNTGTGNSCAGVGGIAGGLQYQCVELVMRHFKRKWNLRWYGNAKDLLTNAPRSTVDVRSNGDAAHPPVPGDMVVWTTGQWGHVALVVGVGASHVDIIEQNVNGNGKARLPYANGRIGARWGSWVPAGWAHAKANTTAPVVNPDGPDGACGRVAITGDIIDDDNACLDLGGDPRWLRAVSGEGFNDDLVWTTATADAVDNSATWNLDLRRAGTYRIDAWVDTSTATAKQARYRVRHNAVVDEVVVDQTARNGWRKLGDFRFAAGGAQRVHLADNTGEAVSLGRKLVFDAVRVTPACANLQVVTEAGASLNVRALPNARSTRVGAVDSGAVVERLDTVDGTRIEQTTIWHEVRSGGMRGFVTGAYVACP